MFCYALVTAAACLLAQPALAQGYFGEAISGKESPVYNNPVTQLLGCEECTRVLEVVEVLGCTPVALKVRISDITPYPTVELSPDLKSATVKRTLPCGPPAEVEISAECS